MKTHQNLVAFVAVAETGAFARAAERLGVSPSVVSHHVARLEDALGQTLIHRSTRKLALSDNGQRLFEAARAGLLAIDQALDAVRNDGAALVGALRIAVPAFIPDPGVEARIMDFALRHPDVALTLDYSDAVTNLVDGAYDIAIRLGPLPSSALMHRKIATVTHRLVATPGFLAAHRSPRQPADLAALPTIAMGPAFDRITLTRRGQRETVALETSRLTVQNIHGALAATRAGLGFGNLPEALMGDGLATGQLVALLPEWSLPQHPVQAVWSGTSRRKRLAEAFVEWMATR